MTKNVIDLQFMFGYFSVSEIGPLKEPKYQIVLKDSTDIASEIITEKLLQEVAHGILEYIANKNGVAYGG